MSVAEAKAPSLRSVTEDLLRTYWEQDQKRKALEREARQIDSAQQLTLKQVEAALNAAANAIQQAVAPNRRLTITKIGG